jgi:hypothetical protein
MSSETASDSRLEYWNDEKLIKRFFDKVNKTDGCWEWIGAKVSKGYGCIGLTKSHKTIKSHRLSYMIHNKKHITDNMFILHSCDNPSCVNPYHLSEGTAQDNSNDARKRNRLTLGKKRGSNHHNSKLTEQQVIEIRQSTDSQSVLAIKYQVSKRLIWNILNQQAWN